MLYAGFSAAAKVVVICTYERLMMRPGGEIWRDFLWD